MHMKHIIIVVDCVLRKNGGESAMFAGGIFSQPLLS